MTDHIEDRVLAAVELAKLHLHLGVVRCEHFADSVSYDVVAAMCRVVAEARAHHEVHPFVDCPDSRCSALAALDAMGGKAE